MEILRRIATMLKPYRRNIILGLILQLIVILTNLAAPYVTQSLVNDVIVAQHIQKLTPLCLMLISLAVVRGLSNYSRSILMEKASQDFAWDTRTSLYTHLEEMPYSFYDHNRVGEIMSRMTGDLESLRNLIAGGIVNVFNNAFCFIGALIFMPFMSWEITLMILLFTPIIAFTAWKFNKTVKPVFRSLREQNAALNTRAQENLAGMHVVKAFVREDYENKLFQEENQKRLKYDLKASWIWSDYVPLMNFLGSLCTPVALLGGAFLIAMGHMDIGTLVGITGYINMLANPMRAVSGLINMMAQSVTSAEKLIYYMDFGASIKEPENPKIPEKFEGHVEFDHVTFAYDDHPVLKDITFEAKPGETVAIMGATGSGKTTLVTLLGRFYDIQKGSLKIDGIDIREQSLKPLRREIGYVAQDTFLFSDTITDNIRFGRPDAGMEKVEKSAQAAQAAEFIEHMPDQYETIIGERGMGLSGGQKQRVSIARAVLTDPAILVMDDSTSAVDMETEYEIQQQLKEVLKNRTTFIIAHRISSVKNADLILIMKDGEIVERGNHKQLMAHNGIYHQMVEDQMSSAVKV